MNNFETNFESDDENYIPPPPRKLTRNPKQDYEDFILNQINFLSDPTETEIREKIISFLRPDVEPDYIDHNIRILESLKKKNPSPLIISIIDGIISDYANIESDMEPRQKGGKKKSQKKKSQKKKSQKKKSQKKKSRKIKR